MKLWLRFALIFCFWNTLTFNALANAPIVEESDNFAIFDEQDEALVHGTENQAIKDQALAENDELRQVNHTNISHDNLHLLDKIKSLQQDIQALHGELELQSHDLALLKEQFKESHKDSLKEGSQNLGANEAINSQKQSPAEEGLSALELTVEPVMRLKEGSNDLRVGKLSRTSSSRMNPADEQISYLAAYELVKNKRYDDALNAMEQFIFKYPNGGYAENAEYWLGELYLVKQNYPKAISHFQTVLSQYPTSSKAASSSLKIGYALILSGKKEEATTHLNHILINYPNTPVAELALAKLRTINSL